MEIKDLRIGNIVRYRDEFNCVIESIGSNGFSSHMKNLSENRRGISCGSDDFYEYNPITLTQEILLKCGLVKGNINKLVFYDLDFYRVYLDENPSFHIQVSNSHWPFLAKCIYLHQLQNLYHSLTGQELNIEL
jgi:hypothetical protein